MGGQGFDGGDQAVMGIPRPPTREYPVYSAWKILLAYDNGAIQLKYSVCKLLSWPQPEKASCKLP